MTDYAFILSKNYSQYRWAMNGDKYDGIDWQDSAPKPTEAQLDADYKSYQEKLAYLDMRNQNFPDIKKLLMMLWDDINNGGALNAGTFYAAIKALYDKYPPGAI